MGSYFTLVILLLVVVCCARAQLRATQYFIGPSKEYEVVVTEESFNPSISIYYQLALGKRRPVANGIEVWTSTPLTPFISLAKATQNTPPISNGNFQVDYSLTALTSSLQITFKEVQDNGMSMYLEGLFLGSSETEVGKFNVTFTCTEQSDSRYSTLQFQVSTELYDKSIDYSSIHMILKYTSRFDETFHGFGEQFTFFDMTGKKVPILVSEQGLGRGLEPLTTSLNALTPGMGGYWYTTYAPKACYLTSYNRSLLLTTPYVSYFDLTHSDSLKVEVEVWRGDVEGQISIGESWLALISAITEYTGRMSPLPEWTQQGAIVGLEGGSDNVTRIVDTLLQNGVPIKGVWLQDWVGLRHSDIDGDRLIWNWQVNRDYYPTWDEMVGRWNNKHGMRVMTYVNPFFSDPSGFVDGSRNFFQEGFASGYFVRNSTGDVYMQNSITIAFATLDLTNPSARSWMKGILINYTFVDAQSSGFMCDFGEYLPFDAVLFNGETGNDYHNVYPQAWGELVQEAIAEYTINHDEGKDITYFMRSGWLKSPAHLSIFWLGDQLQTFDEFDGLQSCLTGALSSGLSGHSLTHSDIGGYNAYKGGPDMTYVRTPELLMRWSEMGAFGFALFRTHIGSSTSNDIPQIYSSPELMQHFAKFANVFGNLSSYRLELMKEAQDYGYPLVRQMSLQYNYDSHVRTLTNQFMMGDEVLVAPVLQGDTNFSFVYIPANSGAWIHLWSGNVIHSGTFGLHLRVPSPLSFPPVFFLSDSQYGQQLRAFVQEQHYCDGYVWKYSDDSLAMDDDDNPLGELNMAEKILLPIFFLLLLIAITWLYVAIYYDKLAQCFPCLPPDEYEWQRRLKSMEESEEDARKDIARYSTQPSPMSRSANISAHNSSTSLYLLSRPLGQSSDRLDRMASMWKETSDDTERDDKGFRLSADTPLIIR